MIPEKTYSEGWPEHLVGSNNGLRYVRLRDGKPTSEFSGESCLYGVLDENDYIMRDHQWVPVLGANLADMRFSGGVWMTAEQIEACGQTPIVLPQEPVEWPQ